MKNINFSVLIVFFLTAACYSQFVSEYGLKIGLTASRPHIEFDQSLNISHVFFEHTRVSPNIGLFIRMLNMKNIDFETQLVYLQKGGKEKFEITTIQQTGGTGEHASADIQFDYLQLHLGFRPKYSMDKSEFYVFAGGSVDYLMGFTGVGTLRNNLKDIIFGYSVGMGISLRTSFDHSIFIETIYNSDISDIYKNMYSELINTAWLFKAGISISNK